MPETGLDDVLFLTGLPNKTSSFLTALPMKFSG